MKDVNLLVEVKEELKLLRWSIKTSTKGAERRELIDLLNDISDSLKECLDKLNAYY